MIYHTIWHLTTVVTYCNNWLKNIYIPLELLSPKFWATSRCSSIYIISPPRFKYNNGRIRFAMIRFKESFAGEIGSGTQFYANLKFYYSLIISVQFRIFFVLNNTIWFCHSCEIQVNIVDRQIFHIFWHLVLSVESHMILLFCRFWEYVDAGFSAAISFLSQTHDHKNVFVYSNRKVGPYYMYLRLIPGIFQIFVVMSFPKIMKFKNRFSNTHI